MSENPNNNWIIALGDQSYFWDICKENNFIVIGWHQFGDLKKYNDFGDLKSDFFRIFQSNNEKSAITTCSQIWDFYNEMDIGDIVFVKKGANKILGTGKISSEYYYDPDKIPLSAKKGLAKTDHDNIKEIFPNIRDVEWIQDFSPDGIDIPNHRWVQTLKKLKDNELRDIFSRIHDGKGVKNNSDYINHLLSSKKQVIMYGPPGTGKTYATKYLAVKVIDSD